MITFVLSKIDFLIAPMKIHQYLSQKYFWRKTWLLTYSMLEKLNDSDTENSIITDRLNWQ